MHLFHLGMRQTHILHQSAYSGKFNSLNLKKKQPITKKKLNVILWGVAFFGCHNQFPDYQKTPTFLLLPPLSFFRMQSSQAQSRAPTLGFLASTRLEVVGRGLCDGKKRFHGETNATNIHERTEVFALIADISREGLRCKLSQNVT